MLNKYFFAQKKQLKICTTLFLLVCWITFPFVSGQEQPYIVEIEHLDTKDGLLGQHVHQIHQDKKGLIWIITSSGLNRHDGRDFKWYEELASEDYYNSGRKIFEDQDGFLWVTEEQPGKYFLLKYLVNTKDGALSPFESIIKTLPFNWEDIISICQGNNETIFFLSKQGRMYSYQSKGKFKQLQIDLPSNNLESKILNFETNNTGWILQRDNLNAFNLIHIDSTGRHTSFKSKKESKILSNIEHIRKNLNGQHLFYQNDYLTHYFVTVSEAGLNINTILRTEKVPDSILQLYSDQISTKTSSHSEEQLFHLLGAKIISPTFEQPYDLIKDYPDLSFTNRVSFYFKSLFNGSNILWIGSDQGIIKLQFKKNRFKQLLKINTSLNQGLSCRKILKSNNGDLIISHKKGLWVNGQTFPINPEAPNNPSFVNYIIEDRYQNFWYLGDHSMFKKEKKKKIVSFELSKLFGQKAVGSYILYETDLGTLLVSGLKAQSIYSPKEHSIDHFKLDVVDHHGNRKNEFHTYSFQKDNSGNLWACTSLGLLDVDLKENTMSSFFYNENQNKRLPSLEAHHFYQDEKGIFWIVGHNLTRWNKETNERKVFTQADGLPSQILHAIYPDDYENLWISTENGITCFNKNTHRIRNYFTSDGITHNEFNRMSHFQDKDGTIYFGGMNGVNVFHPKDFHNDDLFEQKEIAIIATGFEQFSGSKGHVIENFASVLKNKKITLQPNDRFFRIQFTVPHYIQNGLIDYEYKIAGHQEEWENIRENHLLVSGLPYGNYTLHLRAILPSGTYIKNSLVFPIEVLRPFYLQHWFLILAGIFILGFFCRSMQARLSRLKKQKLILQKMVNERTAIIHEQKIALEESNAFKDRLFAIIAHDMKNAVYSFNGVTETIKTFLKFNRPDKVLKMSDAINSSSNKLKHLLDNLLEWALNQRGEKIYHPELISLKEILTSSINSFKTIAEERSISIESDLTIDLPIKADKGSLETILRNLINNAIKFTPNQGKILLSVLSSDEYHTIIVKDTGIGMDDEILSTLFSPQLNKSKRGFDGQQGSGIGLVLVKELVELNNGHIKVESAPQKGTTFHLAFPKWN